MNIVIAGDFAPRYRVKKAVENEDYAKIFSPSIRKIISSADFSLVNFESPIAEPSYKPIIKCGPNLFCPSRSVSAIKYAGFKGVTLANNHILDFGTQGLLKTVEICRTEGLDIVGAGNNLEDASKILYFEGGGKKLAVINCCEHEFSIASNSHAGANPLNPVRQWYQISDAKSNADYVLVIVHGGHEFFQLPSLRMQQTYRFFIDAGADAVVNHHQHCFSGYEIYNEKPIFYGLGNFCFDDISCRNSSWNMGYMVKLGFSVSAIQFDIIPYRQCDESESVRLLNKEEIEQFEMTLNELNIYIGNQNLLNEKIRAYYDLSSERELRILEPYNNRISRKLYRLGLLPHFMKGKKSVQVLNHVDCESHREKLSYALTKSATHK